MELAAQQERGQTSGFVLLHRPLKVWQRGFMNPPFYLLDSWLSVGLGMGGQELAVRGELLTRFTVGFVPVP